MSESGWEWLGVGESGCEWLGAQFGKALLKQITSLVDEI